MSAHVRVTLAHGLIVTITDCHYHVARPNNGVHRHPILPPLHTAYSCDLVTLDLEELCYGLIVVEGSVTLPEAACSIRHLKLSSIVTYFGVLIIRVLGAHRGLRGSPFRVGVCGLQGRAWWALQGWGPGGGDVRG